VKTRRTYLLRWVLFVFFFGFNYSLSYAQKQIAVEWDKPTDILTFNENLAFFSNHNVSHLLVNHPLNQNEIAALDSSGILFFIKLENKFVTKNHFISNSDQYLESISSAKAYYDSSSAFNGIVAFSNSIISQDVLMIDDEDFLEIKDQKIHSVTIHPTSLFTFFEPQGSLEQSLSDFKIQLSENDLSLIIDGEWLQRILLEFPYLDPVLTSENGINPEEIAIPALPAQFPSIHWSIVVLILLWISLAINVTTNPTYLETIPRYFTAHRFYVDDIMSYRERTSASALFLLLQHAIFGGLVSYILAKMFISDTGLGALYYHLPYLAVMGKNYFSLFVLTSVLVLIVELIALIWLYAPNKEMTHFNQGLNLFTSIFHLDFIIVTAIVTGYFGDWNTTLIVLLSLSYLLIWFSSFNITAFDASKKLGMHRNSYLFKTIGLHTLISGALVVLLVVFNEWWDILELAVSV
jgi:hypothetical protein